MADQRSLIFPVLPGNCPGPGYKLVSKEGFVEAPLTPENLLWTKDTAITEADKDQIYTNKNNITQLQSDMENTIDSTELDEAIDALKDNLELQINRKQDTLTPGTNITIENNVISASGGGDEIKIINYSESTLPSATDVQGMIDNPSNYIIRYVDGEDNEYESFYQVKSVEYDLFSNRVFLYTNKYGLQILSIVAQIDNNRKVTTVESWEFSQPSAFYRHHVELWVEGNGMTNGKKGYIYFDIINGTLRPYTDKNAVAIALANNKYIANGVLFDINFTPADYNRRFIVPEIEGYNSTDFYIRAITTDNTIPSVIRNESILTTQFTTVTVTDTVEAIKDVY